MNGFPDKLLAGLEKIAAVAVKEKRHLQCLAIVHRTEAPDGWDLLISSKVPSELTPRSMAALKYVDDHLKKALPPEQRAKIARIVVLPSDNELIAWLCDRHAVTSGKTIGLFPADFIDDAYVVRPTKAPRYWKKLKAALKIVH